MKRYRSKQSKKVIKRSNSPELETRMVLEEQEYPGRNRSWESRNASNFEDNSEGSPWIDYFEDLNDSYYNIDTPEKDIKPFPLFEPGYEASSLPPKEAIRIKTENVNTVHSNTGVVKSILKKTHRHRRNRQRSSCLTSPRKVQLVPESPSFSEIAIKLEPLEEVEISVDLKEEFDPPSGSISNITRSIGPQISLSYSPNPCFPCPTCGQPFNHRRGLHRHKYTHMNWEELEQTKCFHVKCDLCNMICLRKDQYRHHLNAHNNVRSFCCPQCSATFVRKDGLRKHIGLLHPKSKAGKKINKSWKGCCICGKKFPYISRALRHQKFHEMNP